MSWREVELDAQGTSDYGVDLDEGGFATTLQGHAKFEGSLCSATSATAPLEAQSQPVLARRMSFLPGPLIGLLHRLTSPG